MRPSLQIRADVSQMATNRPASAMPIVLVLISDVQLHMPLIEAQAEEQADDVHPPRTVDARAEPVSQAADEAPARPSWPFTR
jgi:hypothetical protein